MKKQLIAIILGATTVLWSNDALSYKKDTGKPSGGSGNVSAKGANCSPANASVTMQFNEVKAFIEQGGSMFQNRQESVAAYEVGGANLFAIYAGALWMGGTDVNGQLKLAALTFRSGNDFWPGPLTVDPNFAISPGQVLYDPNYPVAGNAQRAYGEANIDPDQCLFYDKFYTIRKAEVIQYTIWWECENGISQPEDCVDIQEPSAEVMSRINNWPAHGRVDLGQDYWLAPFYDYNFNGHYDPIDGDIPWYDDILDRNDVICGVDRRVTLFGDETHWWVFNDKGNIHTETNGEPIGMEIRAQAFSFATNDEVNRMTFYNYEMINRGTQTLYDTYFSQYLDTDLGNANDDYVGCDVSRGLGYCYNGDALDETASGNQGYGENPPAIGCDFFEGPYQDADGRDNLGPVYDNILQAFVPPTVNDAIADTGIVYKGIGVGYSDGIIDNERFGMRRFTYYTNGSAFPYTDPSSAAQFYNFMSGSWANGSEMIFGGTGAVGSGGATATPSDYMFPGDSDPLHWATAGIDEGFDWSESDPGNGTANAPGDRRFVQSAGPFTLKPGATNNITVGIVYGRGSDGDPFSSVNAMRAADTKAQALFDACFKILAPPAAPRLVIQELENQLVLMIDNPATSNNYEEGYAEKDEINITDPGVDQYYRFEGYQIYQMVNEDAEVSEITDPSKARLVAQCDIENGIDRVINFEFDEDLGFSIPVEKVDGENNGIRHTFLMKEDEFAQGDRALVNHKTYYYIAVAYAYNSMADLVTELPNLYNPNDPLTITGQKIPFISSFLGYDGAAIAAVAGVPHNPTPEAGGTGQNIAYGSSPIIKRMDGHGNGNRALEFTAASKSKILKDGYYATPSYTYGKGPINIKVVDPLNVADGQFVCKFHDYSTSQRNGADTASWTIIRSYTENGIAKVDSISSNMTINSKNEQIIPEWGVSVEIHQDLYFDPAGTSGGTEVKTTKLISADISFVDSSKIWMKFVQDNDAFYPTNWIRSGTYTTDVFGATPSDCMDPADPFYRDYIDPCNYKDWGAPSTFADPGKAWAGILGGGIAPSKVVGYEASFMPLAYYNYPTPTAGKNGASISFLPSVDIVITSDKSLWTRCPVIELGRSPALNVGGAQPGEMRKSASVDKNGNQDTGGEASTGMGWFPGYAIDLESGARLYMAFGENSFLASENGSDMLWNPTDNFIDNGGTPLMGGMHPIYVYSYKNKLINNFISGYDHPAYVPAQADYNATNQLRTDMLTIQGTNAGLATSQKRATYGSMSWVAYPLAAPGYSIDPQNIETAVTISLRVSKEYKNFVASNENGGKPMYSWDMSEIATVTGSQDQLASILDMINVVPNPYYAYSEYERTRLETKVKITNLPEVCTVKIYTVNGKVVKTFKKDSPITSIDWDLNNYKGIPVAGGVYLIHVSIPSVDGSEPLEKILKFFGGMRQVDLQGI